MFQKFLDYVMNAQFIAGATIGGLGAFLGQIFILGDVSFWLFMLLNVTAAVVVGAIFRSFRG